MLKRQLISKLFPLCVGGTHVQNSVIASTRASESKSHNFLLQSGLIQPASNGVFYYMPAFLRSIEKLTTLIDFHMEKAECQKLSLPALGSKALWDKSGRWDLFGNELIKTKVGGADYCLCPTHEEAICDIMNGYMKQLSYYHLPVRLYQITTKYRNELRPHYGLLRGREFIMKDLYSFDADVESALVTYDRICTAYLEFFNSLNVPVVKTRASTGVIGGNLSHEFHILCDIGEDKVAICKETGAASNIEVLDELLQNAHMDIQNGIEVGHTFFLGQLYSDKFKVKYVDKSSKLAPVEMGCYGLGVTRIIAACIELLSNDSGMRWPSSIAPYQICIIPPKQGSKEFDQGVKEAFNIYDALQKTSQFCGQVIIDDRHQKSIGWRRRHANLIGYPWVIVLGKRSILKNEIEVIQQNCREIGDQTHQMSKDDFYKFTNTSIDQL